MKPDFFIGVALGVILLILLIYTAAYILPFVILFTVGFIAIKVNNFFKKWNIFSIFAVKQKIICQIMRRLSVKYLEKLDLVNQLLGLSYIDSSKN